MSRPSRRKYPDFREGTFLSLWMRYLNGLETAEPFDFWSGIWLLATVIGRQTYVARPQAPVYLNPYVILVSDSGVGHKSTIIDKAIKLYETVSRQDQATAPFLVTGKGSSEQLEDILADHSEIAIASSELARLFGKEGYKMGLPILLTDLYDCAEDQRIFGTKRSGTIHLSKVYCSFLAGSTPIWLARSISPDVLEGGFASRTLFIHADANKRHVAWPEPIDETTIIGEMTNVLQKLRNDARTVPQICLSEGGRERYTSWYNSRQGTTGTYDQYFHSREPDHILRLAALLCINDERWEIQLTDIVNATSIIQGEKERARMVLVPSTKKADRLTTGIEKIRHIIVDVSPSHITRRELYMKVRNYFTTPLFDITMEVLHELGAVDVHISPKTKAKFYSATRFTVSANLLPTIHRTVEERIGPSSHQT